MLGSLQQEVMEVVWSRGDATVAEVHDDLQEERAIAYTTVLSTMRALERRGFLTHEADGKAHRFHALVSRQQYTRDSVDRLVTRLFGGEPERLMSHLVGAEQLSARDLRRIRRLLEGEGRRP
ncbi:MAG: BlaI/MecI/CopY family transcriptional regulator [Planctomycetota bacterium]